MTFNKVTFNKAIETLANQTNSTIEAVNTCYEFDLYDTMARVKTIYTELYND